MERRRENKWKFEKEGRIRDKVNKPNGKNDKLRKSKHRNSSYPIMTECAFFCL